MISEVAELSRSRRYGFETRRPGCAGHDPDHAAVLNATLISTKEDRLTVSIL
jgi:hypothetical protein